MHLFKRSSNRHPSAMIEHAQIVSCWSMTNYNYECHVNSALHPSGVAKSSTSFGWGKGGWGKGGKVAAAGWQVRLCDPIWHVISRSGVVISIMNCYIRVYLLHLYDGIRGQVEPPLVVDVSLLPQSGTVCQKQSVLPHLWRGSERHRRRNCSRDLIPTD